MKKFINKPVLTSLFSSLILLNFQASGANDSLHFLPLPERNIETATIHYSVPLQTSIQQITSNSVYQDTSDEYWLEVTGEDLNNGVALNVSAKNALIRISGKSVSVTDELIQIDPRFVELLFQGKHVSEPFKTTVTAEQLATANIFPNSTALTIKDDLPIGEYKLSVKQRFPKKQIFIINVKEKNSPYKLNMQLNKQHFEFGNDINFSSHYEANDAVASLFNSNQAKHVREAQIKFPNGTIQNIAINQGKNGAFVNIPENPDQEYVPGALHELHLQTTSYLDDQIIRRNNKIAFSYVKPTARIVKNQAATDKGAMLNIDVASEGRYEISAIVSGFNAKGEAKAFMHSRSAYYLTPGEHSLSLKFDQEIIESSGVLPPYKLTQLKLIDQSRLQLMSF